jgi:hypothetical protein
LTGSAPSQRISIKKEFKMRHDKDAQALLRHARIAEGFVGWLREDGERLVRAADLIGGKNWAARATRLVEAIEGGAEPAGLLPDLRVLRRLLRLDLADDPDALEMRLVVDIHPDDPRAENARICAEALDRGVRALAALGASGTRMVREGA